MYFTLLFITVLRIIIVINFSVHNTVQYTPGFSGGKKHESDTLSKKIQIILLPIIWRWALVFSKENFRY
jgi:hypothetical protein